MLDTKVLAPGTSTLVDLMIRRSLIASAICLQQNTAEIWDSPGSIWLTPSLSASAHRAVAANCTSCGFQSVSLVKWMC